MHTTHDPHAEAYEALCRAPVVRDAIDAQVYAFGYLAAVVRQAQCTCIEELLQVISGLEQAISETRTRPDKDAGNSQPTPDPYPFGGPTGTSL